MRPAEQLAHAAQQLDRFLGAERIARLLKQPVILLSAPRSGSTLLFEQLTRLNNTWSIGGESHVIYAGLPHCRFENAQHDSGCLNESHADSATQRQFRASLLYLARNAAGIPWGKLRAEEQTQPLNLIEKTPRNALAIPFIRQLFPEAKFIYLYRQAEQNIASIIEAWQQGLANGRFSTYPDLPGWDRKTWCFLLPPGWRNLRGKSLAEIATFQWRLSNQQIIHHLQSVSEANQICLDYQSLLENPAKKLNELARFIGVKADNKAFTIDSLPYSKTVVSPPSADKWHRFEAEISPLLPNLLQTQQAIANHHRQYALA